VKTYHVVSAVVLQWNVILSSYEEICRGTTNFMTYRVDLLSWEGSTKHIEFFVLFLGVKVAFQEMPATLSMNSGGWMQPEPGYDVECRGLPWASCIGGNVQLL